MAGSSDFDLEPEYYGPSDGPVGQTCPANPEAGSADAGGFDAGSGDAGRLDAGSFGDAAISP